MVPHGALLYKCERAGIHGKLLNFLIALYANPTSSVAVTPETTPDVNISFLVGRGVRQGCPLSPILFNLFIDDLCRSFLGQGVTVPGFCSPVSGLLWADDTVVLAPTVPAMESSLNDVGDWLIRNNMDINVSKCGLMVAGGSDEEQAELKAKEFIYGNDDELVPVVDSYVYLGFPFCRSLSLSESVALRVERVRGKGALLGSFFANPTIPLQAKIDVLRSVWIPSLAFGGEILGMNKALAQPLESLLRRAVRSLTKGWGLSAAAPLRVELQLKSIAASMAGMRARAIAKFPRSATLIGAILRANSFKHRKVTWASGASRWLKRVGIVASPSLQHVKRVQSAVMAAELACDHSKGLARYVALGFEETRSFILAYARLNLSLDRGMAGLVAARTGGLLTGKRAADQDMISASFKTKCPCCRLPSPETLEHLFLECREWSCEREEFIEPLLDMCPLVLPPEGQVAALLGGRSSSGFQLRHWCRSDGDGHPLFIHVAKFLNSIFSRRAQLLWSNAVALTARSEGANA